MKTTIAALATFALLAGIGDLLPGNGSDEPALASAADSPGGRAGLVSPAQIPFDYSVDATGRVRVEVASDLDSYYVLYVRHDVESDVELPVTMALGQAGSTTLTESLAAYPAAHYRVAEFSVAAPGDIDGDGMDDVQEHQSLGSRSPFNPAPPIAFIDGTVSIPDRETFEALSYQGPEVRIDTHLEDLEFVKFYLLEMDTDQPQVYFMNTETHRAHGEFARAVGIERGRGRGASVPGQMRGEIVYHPHVLGPNGRLGIYRFEFEPNDSYAFADVQRAYELLARDMPVLANDFAYYPMPNAALPRYEREKALFDASRVHVILDEEIYGAVDYLPLNIAEGYGLLRVMQLGERPNPRDVVIYEALPNELSRVGGIITTVPQTPLSHVNLRAIQDQVPNAYIAGALQNEQIASLVGKYVYYRVAEREYEIRESSLAEVEAHFESLRPTESQVPVRDLTTTEIRPLDDVAFGDWTSFGVKAANVATLRTFGFADETVPDGFAVPFHFYDEFMRHNGFYDDVRALLADPDFVSDYSVQEARLSELREAIEDGDMPDWMLDALGEMQSAFPTGVSIRCRSSTNNEDLPGFSGAGLYDSVTQHPDEGHIAKSIKQVYASLWNFRAFDERQFYRIDHFETAMGVLVHPSYQDELANGVGVTLDPIYGTEDTYYLNTQIGEDLVTNPDALSIPEEILLESSPDGSYTVVRYSNLAPPDQEIMTRAQLDQLRHHLGIIDGRFRDLYGAEGDESFAMEIEYKVTAEGRLAIKQARPWLSEGYRPSKPAVPTPSGVAATPTAPTATSSVPTAAPTSSSTQGPPGSPEPQPGLFVLYLPYVESS